MAWTPIVDDANGDITYFVEIMRQMDSGYEGLILKNITDFLDQQTNDQPPLPIYYAFYNDAPTEIVLLLRTREPKNPEVVMLGWLAPDPLNVTPGELTATARTVISKIIDWADHLRPSKAAIRAVVPKRMGNAAIHKLHMKLRDAVDLQINPLGAGTLVHQADLGDSWMWYIKKT